MKTPAILQAFKREILPAGAQLLHADDPVTIGGHRLTGRLTSSGSGVIYLAHDLDAGLVTIKTAHAGTTEPGPVRARLHAEAACARRLPSSCTAPLLHDGTGETPPYLVSGYVEGPSLERVIDVKGPLPAAMVAALAADLARVLSAVHAADVVHGNLTPANVVLTKSGLRVIDFGVAQEISASGEPAEIGAVADNPGWLAPELLTGAPPGPACDIFGWGCLVAYAATGHSPYGENTAGPARFQPLDTGSLADPLRRLVDAAVTEDSTARPTAADLTARLDALPDTGTDDPPVAAEPADPADAVVAPAGFAAVPVSRHRPPQVRSRAMVSALITIAALFFAIPTTTEHVLPAPPPKAPRPGSPSDKPHRTSNKAAISLYGAPPVTARRGRSAAKSRSPRGILWMSCTGARSGWCSMPGTKGTDPDPRSPGWRITWTPGG